MQTAALLARERQAFTERNPKSAALAVDTR